LREKLIETETEMNFKTEISLSSRWWFSALHAQNWTWNALHCQSL